MKERNEERKEEKKKKKMKGMETMILVWIIGLLNFCMDFYGCVWVLVCFFSRV